MEIVHNLPHLQALLNSSAASLLGVGYYFVRRHNRAAHRACMLAALIVSTAFLVAYIIFHTKVGYLPFTGQGVIRPIYFALLGSHVLLATLVIPIVLVTITLALRGDVVRHRRIARWTLPIWFYVSVSGVIIYLLAYRIYSQ